jgi:hypothetical protein
MKEKIMNQKYPPDDCDVFECELDYVDGETDF